MESVREVIYILKERIKEASDQQRKAKWLRKTVNLHPNHAEWEQELATTHYRYSVSNRAEYISALLAFHHEIRGQQFAGHESHREGATLYVYDRVLDELREEFSDILSLVQADRAA
jgi:hypothetical protein